MEQLGDGIRAHDRLALYGAGTLGRRALRSARAAGVEPACFVDDTAALQGRQVDGLEVTTLEEACRRFGRELLIVVTILNPRLAYSEARRRILERCDVRVISAFEFAWAHPAQLLPLGAIDSPASVLHARSRIEEAGRVLADRESVRHYVAQVAFRLGLDFAVLPPALPGCYFPRDLVALSAEFAFVDGGAYDGDTIGEFLAACDDRFASITAFEPDPASFARLSAYVDTLAPDVREKISLVPSALGSRPGTIPFNATGDMSAAVAEHGGHSVPVARIDDVVSARARPSIVKLDVEGHEREALLGASELIGGGQARLAVAAYHHPSDLWELPLMIAELQPGGSIFLRTHGHDGVEVVCYGLPSTP